MAGRKIVLLGDLGTDHGGFPPTPVISGSPDVLMDGKPVARMGDPLAMHSKPKHPPHPRAIAGGESSVLINGIPVAVTGSAITCGGVTIGSGSGVAGGGASGSSSVVTSAAASSPAKVAANTAAAGTSTASGPATSSAPSPGVLPNAVHQSRSFNGANPVQATQAQARSTDVSENPSMELSEPGYHVVKEPMSKTELLRELYGDASAKPEHFDRLNPGIRSRVLPGEMIVLGDPSAHECTVEEARLMDVAARVNQEIHELTEDEARFLANNYDFLEFMVSSGSAGLGAGAFAISQQLNSIKASLTELEELHQRTYTRYGHLNHETFYNERRSIFKRLDFALGKVAKSGLSLDGDASLKRALGLSSKSIVHHWKSSGVGDIPGYSTHFSKLARAAKFANGVGYAGIGLGFTGATLAVKQACTFGTDKACEKAPFTEFGRFGGSTFGGWIGGATGVYACVAIGGATAGVGGVACALIFGGGVSVGGAALGGTTGQQFGEKVYELIVE